MDPRYYERKVLVGIDAPFFDQATNMMSLPPTSAFGNLIANAPPNITYPGFLNINRTNDVSISLTKVQGRHTMKFGFYLNHSYKAQNTGGRRRRVVRVPGRGQLRQRLEQPVSTRASATPTRCLGSSRNYTQSSRFVEGSFLYDNVDWYAQDNWRVNSRLTVDYGLRFVHQQPQYDQYLQSSNWFLDKWSLESAAAALSGGVHRRA